MTESQKEKLSAFMDGEMETKPAGLLSELSHDAELKGSWARYHLISDCLKQQLPDYLDPKLHTKVAQALADEPVVLAPVKKQAMPNIFKPAAGFAIAASVAAVAILGIQQPAENSLDSSNDAVVANNLIADPVLQRSVPIPVRQVSIENNNAANPHNNSAEIFNRYLVNHNEHRVGAGMQGILPYVRVVTDEKR